MTFLGVVVFEAGMSGLTFWGEMVLFETVKTQFVFLGKSKFVDRFWLFIPLTYIKIDVCFCKSTTSNHFGCPRFHLSHLLLYEPDSFYHCVHPFVVVVVLIMVTSMGHSEFVFYDNTMLLSWSKWVRICGIAFNNAFPIYYRIYLGVLSLLVGEYLCCINVICILAVSKLLDIHLLYNNTPVDLGHHCWWFVCLLLPLKGASLLDCCWNISFSFLSKST